MLSKKKSFIESANGPILIKLFRLPTFTLNRAPALINKKVFRAPITDAIDHEIEIASIVNWKRPKLLPPPKISVP